MILFTANNISMRKTRNIKRKLLKKRHTRKNKKRSRRVKLIKGGEWKIYNDPQNLYREYCAPEGVEGESFWIIDPETKERASCPPNEKKGGPEKSVISPLDKAYEESLRISRAAKEKRQKDKAAENAEKASKLNVTDIYAADRGTVRYKTN
jgi:hypothetical protein